MKKISTLLLFTCYICAAFATVDVSITYVDVKRSTVINKAVSFSLTLENTGTETVTSVDIHWNLSSANSALLSGFSLMPGESRTFSNVGTLTLTETKKHTFSVTVDQVNGKADAISTNNSFSQSIHGTTREAIKKAVAEEATGSWCGFCPRGIVYMDLAKEEFGDQFIGIAVHNSDPMEDNTYDAAIADYPGFSGYPSVILDRKLLIDPSALLIQVPNRLDEDPIAEISIFGNYDEASEELHVTLKVEFLSADDGLDYRLNVVLTEDSVTGTTAGYNQTNYYSGGSYGPLYGWEDLPYTVPAEDMVYQFVAREIVDGWDGTEGSVPTAVTAGQVITYDYEIDIDDDWDIEKINVIGLLTDYDDPKNEILNANSARMTSLSEYVGIQEQIVTNAVTVYPNPAADIAYIRVDLFESAEISIRVSDLNGKTVQSAEYGIMTGNNVMPINTNMLPAGIYVIDILAGAQLVTEKLYVTH